MSANVQEKRKNLDELSPGQCPRCRNGGPSGDEWTVSLYWNEGEAVFHCVICGYREYVPLQRGPVRASLFLCAFAVLYDGPYFLSGKAYIARI